MTANSISSCYNSAATYLIILLAGAGDAPLNNIFIRCKDVLLVSLLSARVYIDFLSPAFFFRPQPTHSHISHFLKVLKQQPSIAFKPKHKQKSNKKKNIKRMRMRLFFLETSLFCCGVNNGRQKKSVLSHHKEAILSLPNHWYTFRLSTYRSHILHPPILVKRTWFSTTSSSQIQKLLTNPFVSLVLWH